MKIICPLCGGELDAETIAAELGRLGGKSKSKAKQEASRENGKKGGRPRKASNLERRIARAADAAAKSGGPNNC